MTTTTTTTSTTTTATPPRAEAAEAREAVIDRLVARARSRLHRVDPHEAAAAAERGALLVDIRPVAQRAASGEIPGALVIERNVLEWRLDPTSPDRIDQVGCYDAVVVIICEEGYASSLAAATLHDLGLRKATDLAGGFQAWKAAGLPVRRQDPDGSSS